MSGHSVQSNSYVIIKWNSRGDQPKRISKWFQKKRSRQRIVLESMGQTIRKHAFESYFMRQDSIIRSATEKMGTNQRGHINMHQICSYWLIRLPRDREKGSCLTRLPCRRSYENKTNWNRTFFRWMKNKIRRFAYEVTHKLFNQG